MFAKKKILVSGATGCVGSNIVRHFLNEGADISVLIRESSNKWRIEDVLNDVRDFRVDLRDEARLQGVIKDVKPDVIFHNAAYGGFSFQSDQKKILDTNLFGTVNLLNACKKSGFDLFINAGSSSEYGIKHKPMREDDMLEPITIYGVAKASATQFCKAVGLSENLPIVTLRLFSPFGFFEDSRRLVPSVILSCLKGEDPQLSSPDSVRDFIFIEDVLDAYAKTLESKDCVLGEVINIGSGCQFTTGEVVREIIRLTGSDVKPMWGTVDNPRYEPQFWLADITKAGRLLNWRPQSDLSDGLRKSIYWVKENIAFYKDTV